MKHLALVRVVELVQPARYLESHAGGFDYSLAERQGPLPDGVWDFMAAATSVRTLDESGYAAILRSVVGTQSGPGTYPGSTRLVWETIGQNAAYLLNDTDAESVASVASALESRGPVATVSWQDGIDMVVDEARSGDLVLIDPFDPEVLSPEHGLSATGAFDALIARGVSVMLWRAINGDAEPGRGVRGFDLCVGLRCAERTGSMDGCEIIIGGISTDVAAEIAKLSLAHGSVLGNGHIRIESARRPQMMNAREPGAASISQVRSEPL